jgi:hypothetical protein
MFLHNLDFGESTMKTIFVSFLFFAAAASSLAQAPDTLWTRIWGGPTQDEAYDALVLPSGSIVVSGRLGTWGDGSQAFARCLTVDGTTQWARTYSSNASIRFAQARQFKDGRFVFAGSHFDGNDKHMILFTDSTGIELNRVYTDYRDHDGAMAVALFDSTGFVTAGYAGAPIQGGDWDYIIEKYDLNGARQWYRLHDVAGHRDIAMSIEPCEANNFIVSGKLNFGGGSFIAKIDSEGNPIWTRTYGQNQGDENHVTEAIATTDGGFIFATSLYDPQSQLDAYVIKLDANGNDQWARRYGGTADDEGTCIYETPEGNYVFAGGTRSYGSGGSDIWVVCIDNDGDSLWSKTVGGVNDEFAHDISPIDERHFVVTGYTASFGEGQRDAYVICFLVNTGPVYPNVGYVTLISPGPPNWGYRLHWVSGSLSRVAFFNFCSGTIGSVSGAAQAAGWTAANYGDSIVFTTATPLTSGSIETFWLTHPYCAAQVTWTAGDSSGSVDGPLPVELLGFNAASVSGGIELQWSTASETNNDFFEIMRGVSSIGAFARIATLPSQGNSATGHHYEYLDREVEAGRTYWYYLADVDLSGNRTEHRELMRSATMAGSAELPSDYSLSAYPNPFNPSTTISFALPEADIVRIAVYDVSGRWIQTLVNEQRAAGRHTVTFDARDLPSGVYFARMESGSFALTRKLLLFR